MAEKGQRCILTAQILLESGQEVAEGHVCPRSERTELEEEEDFCVCTETDDIKFKRIIQNLRTEDYCKIERKNLIYQVMLKLPS